MSFLVPQRYRRSLAGRVTLLTTIAVGLAVTCVAFAAYATVRMQSLSSLDESLRSRAAQAAHTGTLERAAAATGAGLGAGRGRRQDRCSSTPTTGNMRGTNGPVQASTRIYGPEADGRPGRATVVGAHRADRVRALPRRRRARPVGRGADPGPVAAAHRPDARPPRAGDAAVRDRRHGHRRAGRAGRVARNGLRPVRRLTTRSSRSPAPSSSTRSPSRATTRSPGWRAPSTRCWPRSRRRETGSASSSPTPVTSCGRR